MSAPAPAATVPAAVDLTGPDRVVVIVTHEFDPTADMVVTELNRRGAAVVRFDCAEFPRRLCVTAELDAEDWSGRVVGEHRSLGLEQVSGIYYRRPTGFELDPAMSDNERRWAGVQARLGLGGLLAALDPWLNHPHRIGLAEYKPVQLRAARVCGLCVPRTLLTNDPAAARAFVAGLGRAVYKPLGGNGVHDPDGPRQVYASIVEAGECVESIAATMHLFQAWVAKAFEVRLTVVDGWFFAARIDAGSPDSHIDWRTDYAALRYSVISTPDTVRAGVTALMARLGLRFAALDFVVTPDGDWWFLECNPNGQWGWIEDETGFPIAAALADALTLEERA